MDVPRVGVDGSMASCLPILVISVYNDQQRRDVSLRVFHNREYHNSSLHTCLIVRKTSLIVSVHKCLMVRTIFVNIHRSERLGLSSKGFSCSILRPSPLEIQRKPPQSGSLNKSKSYSLRFVTWLYALGKSHPHYARRPFTSITAHAQT